jgi:hypothetical protein
MNVSDEPVMVLKGTTVALVQPVRKVNLNAPISQESHQEDGGMKSDEVQVPDHLKSMVDVAARYLTQEQRLELEKVIMEYQDIFMEQKVN